MAEGLNGVRWGLVVMVVVFFAGVLIRVPGPCKTCSLFLPVGTLEKGTLGAIPGCLPQNDKIDEVPVLWVTISE